MDAPAPAPASSQKPRNRSTRTPARDKADASSVSVRRERNRQAQHVFRARKQAEQQEKDERIQRLENEIEKMGSIFFNLADAIAGSEHARRDAALMHTLQDSMKQVVHLAGENTVRFPDATPPDLASSPERRPSITGETTSITSHIAEKTVETTAENTVETTEATAAETAAEITASTIQVHDAHLANNEPSIQATSSEWTLSLPPTLHPKASNSKLSNRIIQGALQFGYTILARKLDLCNEVLATAVGFTLRHQTREQTLINVEWALGAGNWFMPMLASHGFDTQASKDVLNHLFAQQRGRALRPGTPPCDRIEVLMNALEVEEYIMARSTGYVDGDVMELALPSQQQQQVIPRNSESQPPQNYLNLDTFFPGERQGRGQQQASDAVLTAPMGQERRVIRISQRRLVRNMTSIFICTSDGPAFCTGSLERAITASVIV